MPPNYNSQSAEDSRLATLISANRNQSEKELKQNTIVAELQTPAQLNVAETINISS